MKCEICHTADAQQAVIRKVEGQEGQELYVCAACAASCRQEAPSIVETVLTYLQQMGGAPDDGAKPAQAAPDATLEIVSPPREPTCPHCGITRADYRKVSRLGCATCYETFADELAGVIADMHRIPRHTGKTPKCPAPSKKVRRLMRQLAAAEQEQRPKDAAELRDAIRLLGWEPDTTDGGA